MASPAKAIHDRLIEVLKGIPTVKGVASGFVPNPSAVTVFPYVAVDYALTTREEGRVLHTMDTVEEIDLYVYNQQKANKYDDIMSEVCEAIDTAIQKDVTLGELCVSCYVSQKLSDGGVLQTQGGRCLYRLTVTCKYIERCTA